MAELGTSTKKVESFNGLVAPKGTRTEVVEVNTPDTGPLILPWTLTLSPNEEVSVSYGGITISGLPDSNTLRNFSRTERTYNFTISFGNIKESVTDGSLFLAVKVLNIGEPLSPNPDRGPTVDTGTGPPSDGGVDTGTGNSGGGGTSGGGRLGNGNDSGGELPERDDTLIR